MCGRFFVETDDETEELRRLVSEMDRRTPGLLKTSGEMAPGDTLPVLAPGRTRKSGLYAMRWGYRLCSGKLVFNTRSETAMEKPLFRNGIIERRCLIPASGYFEWDASHVRYRIRPRQSGRIYLAGIYRLEEQTPVFSVLTTSPADVIRPIHDRMPVILPEHSAAQWLERNADPAECIRQSGIPLQCLAEGQLQFSL